MEGRGGKGKGGEGRGRESRGGEGGREGREKRGDPLLFRYTPQPLHSR